MSHYQPNSSPLILGREMLVLSGTYLEHNPDLKIIGVFLKDMNFYESSQQRKIRNTDSANPTILWLL